MSRNKENKVNYIKVAIKTVFSSYSHVEQELMNEESMVTGKQGGLER